MKDQVPTFAVDGAERFPAAISGDMEGILAALTHLPAEQAGVRIHGIEDLRKFLAAGGSFGSIVAARLGMECRPVRAILFDKNSENELVARLASGSHDLR